MPSIGGTILPSTARTADATVDLTSGNFKSAIFTIDVTADPALASITPRMQVADGNGDYNTIWSAAAAVAAVGTTTYLFSPGVVAADFNGTEAVSFGPPGEFRWFMDAADGDSMTYSVTMRLF